MSRAICVRRGYSWGSWPSRGGTFSTGGGGVPSGLAAVNGPASNTNRPDPWNG